MGERYCEAHRRERAPFQGAERSNEALYNTTRWRKLRRETLREQPLCRRCGAEHPLEVHHVRPPRGDEDLFFDPDNLTTLCSRCHRAETNREIRDRRR
jgi:5-methylcytosine-specific restriction protein A